MATEGQDPRQISGFITGRKSCDSKCPRNRTPFTGVKLICIFLRMVQRGGTKRRRGNKHGGYQECVLRCSWVVLVHLWLFLSFSSINTSSLSFCLLPLKSYRWGKTMFIDLLFDLVAHQDCVCMSLCVCLCVCVCERDTKKGRRRFKECCGRPSRLKPLKHAHVVFSRDAYLNMNIEHQGVQKRPERRFRCLIHTTTRTQIDTNMHKDVFVVQVLHTDTPVVLPRSQSAGPDSPCWCSSAVINSLTLCVKNSNPTHSFPSLSFLLPSLSRSPSFSLSPPCLDAVVCCPLCVSLASFPPLWLLSVSVSFSKKFLSTFPHPSLLLIPSCPLSSIFLSLLHSTSVTSS